MGLHGSEADRCDLQGNSEVLANDPPKPPLSKGGLGGAFAVLGSILAAGVALRLHRFLIDRSLWHDEAMLALNILGRDVSGLFEPLDMNQAAPVGVLLLVKLATSALGPGELALRAVPMLAGTLALPLFWWMFRPFLSTRGMAVGLLLLGANDSLIYYATEAKQYSSDVFWAILILGVGLRWMTLGSSPTRRGALLVIGCAAPWFSHPAVFLLAAVGSAMIVQNLRHGDYRAALLHALVAAAWAASFLTEYVLVLAEQTRDGYLLDYWRTGFPPNGEGLAAFPGWAVRTSRNFLDHPAGLATEGLAALLLVIGCVSLARVNLSACLTLGLVGVILLIAALAEKYPLKDRLMLFALPPVYLLLAGGADRLWASLSPRFRGCGWVMLALIAGPMLVASGKALYSTEAMTKEELAPVLAVVKDRGDEQEPIYVYSGTVPAFRYYVEHGDFAGLAERPLIVGSAERGNAGAFREEAGRIAEHPRVWLVFAHVRTGDDEDADDEELLLRVLRERGGTCSRVFETPGGRGASGCAAYLWED